MFLLPMQKNVKYSDEKFHNFYKNFYETRNEKEVPEQGFYNGHESSAQ